MTNIIEIRPLSASIKTALESAGLTVGLGERPDGVGWQGATGLGSFTPYAVVHHIDGDTDGPIGAPNDDAVVTYQINGIGATSEQAEWVGDKARLALCTPAAFTASGRAVSLVRLVEMGGTRRDDTVEPVVWMTSDRFDVHTTPT